MNVRPIHLCTDRPLRVAAAPPRLLQPGAAQLLEAQVEAEGAGALRPRRAQARLPVENAAALLAGGTRLFLQRRLRLRMPLLHHLQQRISANRTTQ